VLQGCAQNDIEKTLKKLPRDLDETYARILNNIAQSASSDRVIRLLQCLSVAIRPLRVQELADVFALDFDRPEGAPPELKDHRPLEDRERDVLSICSSLILLVGNVVGNEDSGVIQFSHFSVKEFLTSDRLSTSKKHEDISHFHIAAEPAHTTLAQACLGTLLQLDDSSIDNQVEGLPLAIYASQYWVVHAQFGMVSSRIDDGMRRLFDSAQPHFAAWLQLYYDEDFWPFFGDYRAAHRGSPLYYASLYGFRDLAAHIIADHPEQVNERSGRNHFPLAAALYKRHFDIAELLHQHGAAVDLRGWNNRILLHTAISEGYVDVMRWLLSHGLDAESEDENGWTPIIAAAANGYLATAQALLGHGVRINATNEYGYTALHLASFHGQAKIVGLLLQHRANISIRDTDYCTPSHLASFRRKPKVARLLLDHVADIEAKGKDGRTPLHLASCNGKPKTVRLLLDRGANVNAQDNDGSAPLHLASSGNLFWHSTFMETNSEIVRLLLNHGARVDVKDNNGRTPLQVEKVGATIAQILAERDG
jgi:ankyrin repeat protein